MNIKSLTSILLFTIIAWQPISVWAQEKASEVDEKTQEQTEKKREKRSPYAYPVEAVIGGAVSVGITEIMKNKIHELRPNGDNYESMPSRHTSLIFTATTLISMEFSDVSPWIPVACYALGSGMGIERVMSRNHYPGDVFAGAGVGTFSGAVGYILTNLAFGRTHNYEKIKNIYFDYTPYLSVETGAVFPLNDDYGNYRLGTGISTSIRGVVPFGKNWGATARVALNSAPVKTIADNIYVSPLNTLGFLAGVNAEGAPWDIPMSFGASAEIGYLRTLSCKHLSVSKNTPVLKAGVSIAMPITTMFTISVDGGYEVYRIKISGTTKASQNATVSLSTRAYF